MCLWALVQENVFCACPTKQKLQTTVRKHWPASVGPISIKPGPTLDFPFVAWVPRDRERLYFEGMKGWFNPEAKTIFTATFRSTLAPFTALNLWYSHPSGCVGKIIDRAVKRQQPFLLNYFLNINDTLCMLADTPTTHTPTGDPNVLLTRYMDNMYIVPCNIPPNIKMKWESCAELVDWCDARLHSTPHCDITMKGVPMGGGVNVRSRWPDACSQNCPTVLASMIPALCLKSCQKAGSRLALTANLRTVVQGCGYKGHPWGWWWLPFRNCLMKCRLLTHLPLYLTKG